MSSKRPLQTLLSKEGFGTVMIYVFQVHICNLCCLSRFQSATQQCDNCVTLKVACSVAVNGSSHWMLFGPVNHKDRLTTIHRNTWRNNDFTSHLQLFFCCGAQKAPPIFWFLKSKQPTSHLCQYLPAMQYSQTELLFRWSPTIRTSLYRNKITLAPKNIILGGKRLWGTTEIMIVRNGRTLKIHIHPWAKLISPFFGKSHVLFNPSLNSDNQGDCIVCLFHSL